MFSSRAAYYFLSVVLFFSFLSFALVSMTILSIVGVLSQVGTLYSIFLLFLGIFLAVQLPCLLRGTWVILRGGDYTKKAHVLLGLIGYAFLLNTLSLISSAPLSFILFITGFSARYSNVLFFLVFLAFVAFVLESILIIILSLFSIRFFTDEKFRRDFWETSREVRFKSIPFFSMDTHFEMVPGERIIYPVTACYYKSKRWLFFFGHSFRDIIVTNKRILISSYYHMPFVTRIWFGNFNWWHKSIDLSFVPPSRSLFGHTGGNFSLNNLEYAVDAVGEYLHIKIDYNIKINRYFFPKSIKIYHPNSKQIFEFFSKPLNK